MTPAPLPLILGAQGRVGRLIAPHLPRGVTLAARQAAPGGLRWDPLAGPDALLRHIETAGRPSALVVLAGATPATGPDMRANVDVALAALAAARAAGIRRVLLASSAAVYGGARVLPWRETDAAHPASAYGIAKLEMEAGADAFRGAGLEVTALRIGNVAGADALLLNAGSRDAKAPGGSAPPLKLDRFADGEGPWRSYIGPKTLSALLLRLSDPALSLPDCLNLGAPVPVAMSALLEAAEISFEWQRAPSHAAQNFTLDCSRLAALTGLESESGTADTLIAEWRASLPNPGATPRP